MSSDSRGGYTCILKVVGRKNIYKISYIGKDPEIRFKEVKNENKDINLEYFDHFYVYDLQQTKDYFREQLKDYKYGGYGKRDFYQFSDDTENQSFIDFIYNYNNRQNTSQAYV